MSVMGFLIYIYIDMSRMDPNQPSPVSVPLNEEEGLHQLNHQSVNSSTTGAEVSPNVQEASTSTVPFPLPGEPSSEDIEAIRGSSHDESRSLKRKEPDYDSDNDEGKVDGGHGEKSENNHMSKKVSRKTMNKTESSDEEEETCNPMVSDDEFDPDEENKGDRIGTTVYSECHVLSILMKWVNVRI